jgi:hypothetical protein
MNRTNHAALRGRHTIAYSFGQAIRPIRFLKPYTSSQTRPSIRLTIPNIYNGLPPGSIAIAIRPAIDAVLNREAHDFLFFCAREDFIDSPGRILTDSFGSDGITWERILKGPVRRPNL